MALREENRYNYMENVLQDINRHFISLPEEDVRQNNKILNYVLKPIIEIMKKDTLFKSLFERTFYGGSYYDGLKVGKPEEYDLDLLFTLRKYAGVIVSNSNLPGYVHVQVKPLMMYEQLYALRYPGLKGKLLDNDDYVVTSKVYSWVHSILRRALNEFSGGEFRARIVTPEYEVFYVTFRTSSTAFTLMVKGTVDGQPVNMDIDLVPCFAFTEEKWPRSPSRPYSCRWTPEFFVVPKKPHDSTDAIRYWRLSFQQQERVLINNLGNLKPVVRFLKKLRDVWDHKCIASYYIKTIFLWEVENNRSMFSMSLSYVFMEMLKKYAAYIEQGCIPYYWNRANNLIEKPRPETLRNIANRLRIIIMKIENNPGDPYVVAKYLLTQDEYWLLISLTEADHDAQVANAIQALHRTPESAQQPTFEEVEERLWCTLL